MSHSPTTLLVQLSSTSLKTRRIEAFTTCTARDGSVNAIEFRRASKRVEGARGVLRAFRSFSLYSV